MNLLRYVSSLKCSFVQTFEFPARIFEIGDEIPGDATRSSVSERTSTGAHAHTSLTLFHSATMKESDLVAFCYDAKIPRGKSLEETNWWILSDFFASLDVQPKSIPVLESANRVKKVLREDGGPNHYNIIQIKGRTACFGQPKMGGDGSVQYY